MKRLLLILACLVAFASATIAAPPAAQADPVLTPELLARLLIYTRDVKVNGSVNARICKLVGMSDGTADMPMKMCHTDFIADGDHYFSIPPQTDSKDIFVFWTHGTTSEFFLTDKTLKLRAAGILVDKDLRLIPNEKAADTYKAQLSLFAKEAADLPPSDSAGSKK